MLRTLTVMLAGCIVASSSGCAMCQRYADNLGPVLGVSSTHPDFEYRIGSPFSDPHYPPGSLAEPVQAVDFEQEVEEPPPPEEYEDLDDILPGPERDTQTGLRQVEEPLALRIIAE